MQNKPDISIIGAGWLGLPLANYLLASNYSVKLSTRSEKRLAFLHENTGADIFQLDMQQLDTVATEFFTSQLLIVNIPYKNVEAFSRLVEIIQNSLIEKVLFISSTSTYKNVNREVTEDSGDEDEMHPLYQIEQLFSQSRHFKTTILRFAGLVGYERHPGKWFQNKPVSQPEAPVNLIHRDDCIGIIDAIIKKNVWGEVFNGCSSTHPSKREYYTYARSLLSQKAPDFSESSELNYKIVSNKKVINELAYDFFYPDIKQCKNFRVVL